MPVVSDANHAGGRKISHDPRTVSKNICPSLPQTVVVDKLPHVHIPRAQKRRIRGSNASRSPSPTKLKPSTVTKIASPGKAVNQGAMAM